MNLMVEMSGLGVVMLLRSFEAQASAAVGQARDAPALRTIRRNVGLEVVFYVYFCTKVTGVLMLVLIWTDTYSWSSTKFFVRSYLTVISTYTQP